MLSKTCRYGVRAVLYLSIHTDVNALLGVKELSQKIEVSIPMLSKVLQFLTRKNVIKSKKGRNGGFYMTENQKNMHLMDVIQQLERSEYLITACLLGQKHCTTHNNCPYHEKVAAIRTELRAIYNRDSIRTSALKLKQNL